MKIALLGYTQSGKKTLFELLTGRVVPESRKPGEVVEGISSIQDTRVAGLSRLCAGLGDKVLAGEPIGAMGSKTGSANHLYIELRQSGRPINPLPWLTANRIKVSG